MTKLPNVPVKKQLERYQARLIESSWVILDMTLGARAGKARYTVEVQANWTADMLNAAYQRGIELGNAKRERRLEEREGIRLIA